MKQSQRNAALGLSLSCLFAALLCAAAYITIPLPIGPVPLALANLFALLSGLILGPSGGALAVSIYLALGALGFPVFSGGRGGIAHLAGPTGGYLAGYLAGAAAAGLILSILAGDQGKKNKASWWKYLIASACGFAIVLGLGTAGLKLIGGMSWGKALAVGLLPFVPGDAIKALLAALVAAKLRPFADSLRSRGKRRA
jgi:Uncharacterized conserved protein